jgi:hypothetical protein
MCFSKHKSILIISYTHNNTNLAVNRKRCKNVALISPILRFGPSWDLGGLHVVSCCCVAALNVVVAIISSMQYRYALFDRINTIPP